jgi:hypothetical protein
MAARPCGAPFLPFVARSVDVMRGPVMCCGRISQPDAVSTCQDAAAYRGGGHIDRFLPGGFVYRIATTPWLDPFGRATGAIRPDATAWDTVSIGFLRTWGGVTCITYRCSPP